MGVRNPLVQHALAGITCILVLGALSMIWPVIITLFLGLFLLFQSCSPEQEISALLWTEVDNWPIFVDSLRRLSSATRPSCNGLLTSSSGASKDEGRFGSSFSAPKW